MECPALFVTRHGGPEVLQPRELEIDAPGEDEVVVEARAMGVNFADVYARMGLYEAAPPPPFVPGFEVAGLAQEKLRSRATVGKLVLRGPTAPPPEGAQGG